jgi:hypothetical protein
MGYTTLAALKSFGGFEGDDENVILSALIGSATSAIENYTQRVFQIDSESEQDFNYTYASSLPGESRFSGSTLYFYEELAASGASITDNPTVIYLPEDGPPYYGIYMTDGSWASPTVTIFGWWGYSKTPPPDIEMACLRLSKWLYDMRDTSSGSSAVITPEGRVLLPQGLPSDVKQLLAPYRKVTVV